LNVDVLFRLRFQVLDQFVVHGAGVSLVQCSDRDVVAVGGGRDEDELTWDGNLTHDGEVRAKETQVVAEMNKDVARAGAPDVLTFALDLPIENSLGLQRGGIEENRTYRTH